MICSWCRVEYVSNPLFHICADGTNFIQRSEKTQTELEEEHGRQDRLRKMRQELMAGHVADPRASGEAEVILPLTPEDVDFLIALKIKV